MAASKKPPKQKRLPISFRWNSIEGASFELASFAQREYTPSLPNNNKQISQEPDRPKVMGTAELISAVDRICDHATRLSIFQLKANLNHNRSGCQKEDVFCILCKQETGKVSASDDCKCSPIDGKNAGQFSPVLQPELEFVKVTQKMSVFESCGENYAHSSSWRFLQGGTNLPNEAWRGRGLTSVGFLYELQNVYQWMREISCAGNKNPINVTEIEEKRTFESCIPLDTAGFAGCSTTVDTTHATSNFARGNTNCNSGLLKSEDPRSCTDANVLENRRTASLCLDYLLWAVQDTKVDGSDLRTSSSSLYADYHLDFLASCNNEHNECQRLADADVCLENKRKQHETFVTENENRMEVHSSAGEKPQYAFAKQEHAFAGALAGTFVSLSLHPVDTVKTVIQSCRSDQKSICDIGKSIISERGLTGLYRGIASNIASSAPISAVYTFAYESVKGALLPHLPKEYSSVAHCLGAGCASVATSFIFTPSEHVKQQMQIGSHYRNCWNALVGVLREGGLPSLYAGWGAVLCRNVPHSIIKFYTYESLKQVMLSSSQPSAQPTTLQTLVCGGLAGSTAALFTTPFDVVKTRLQTQIPGCMSQYSSVGHALQEIGRHEGLKGLYRGLIPRLVIYMSQGAIFFASYEFFKSVLSLGLPQLYSQKIHPKEKEADDSALLPSRFPLTSSSTEAVPSS